MEPEKDYIVKSSGERERFAPSKLRNSLARAGAPDNIADEIVEHILGELQEGMSTTHIYRHAFSLLQKSEQKTVAARYSMRRAIFGLGPSGFPFEDYIAEIFKARGYTIVPKKIIVGQCAIHEVDMVAYNDKEHIGAEIKFHNKIGIKTDLKVALYVRERFEDLKRGSQTRNKPEYIDKGMLITNTKFTKHVVSYAKCSGLSLLSWNYPKVGNLEDLIKETGVYPVTALTSLSQKEKTHLIENKVVLCSGLENKIDILTRAGVPDTKIATVIDESQALCQPLNGIE